MDSQTIQTYRELWNLLPTDVQANLKFAKGIIKKDPLHHFYFFGEYSKPILSWIIIHALDGFPTESAIVDISGKYYEFVAQPFEEDTKKPQWYQLHCYQGRNNQKLKGWLQTNGRQWFIKDKLKEAKDNHHNEIESISLDALLGLDKAEEEITDEELAARQKVKKAWTQLSDKDKEVLTVLVLHKTHWTKAWEKLSRHIKPEEGYPPMETWSNKTKQDALARLKIRAKKHLKNRFNR